MAASTPTSGSGPSKWMPSPTALAIAGGVALGAVAGAAAASVYFRNVARTAAPAGVAKWATAAATARAGAVARGAHDAGLKAEQLSRNRQFFGVEGQTAVEAAFVVVVGVGGVGSHAAHMLARSGVRKLRLVDFDNVTSSSLNRHAVATREDVGRPKVESLRRVLGAVVPWVEVEAIAEKFEAASAEAHLGGQPDYVLDCIDDMATKAALLNACAAMGLPVLASMGAGGRCDPTALRVAPLSLVAHDPLAVRLRSVLREGAGLRDSEYGGKADPTSHIRTVYAGGKPAKGLLPLSAEQAAAPQEFGAMDGMRLRVMPVLGTLPAMFGQAMATLVLCDLAGQEVPAQEFPTLNPRSLRSHKTKLLVRERLPDGRQPNLSLSLDDIEFIVCTVWRQRSGLSDTLMQAKGAKLGLCRWNKDAPLTLDNIILTTQGEGDRLMAEGTAWVDPAVAAAVQERLAWAKAAMSQ